MADSKTGAAAPRKWRTIKEQLAASKVIHGSALEALIRANQDFTILAPEEATDDLPFPPWLRVYIRKTHPELPFTGPRVVYPLFVNEIYSWMRKNQDLGGVS
jgi:hypothetical protein